MSFHIHCDRCTEKTPQSFSEGWLVRSVKVPNPPNVASASGTQEVDLCPRCIEGFRKWWVSFASERLG